MWIDALDQLAIELEHEAQHSVCSGVLRPEVDGKFAVGQVVHLFAIRYSLFFSSPGNG
jgi:hypothetical protein